MSKRKENPRLLSYVVAWDGGLAPNPGYTVENRDNYLTLAVCKPVIRRTAREGDWVVGLSGSQSENRIVYAMLVSQLLTFSEYYSEPNFQYKKPNLLSPNHQIIAGDNFYKPFGNGEFQQLPSLHSNPDLTPNLEHQKRDLSGVFVLAALEYYYYGNNALVLPKEFNSLIVRRGHRVTKDQRVITKFRKWMDGKEVGIHGEPRLLKSNNSVFLPDD